MKVIFVIIFLSLITNVEVISKNKVRHKPIIETSRFDIKGDTATALLKVKKRYNRKARIFVAVGIFGIVGALFAKNSNSSIGETVAGGSAGLVAVGLFHIIKNNKFFNQITKDFQKGKPIPKNIVTQIRKEDFN